jgi:hypothetical protein
MAITPWEESSWILVMTKKESLHIILHSEEWCHELFLPFTRYVNGKKEYAFLVGNSQINFEVLGHQKPTLYVGNMFDLNDLFPQLKQMPQASYESFDAMLDDGWEID